MDTIHSNDFCFARQGKVQGLLTEKDIHLIKPVFVQKTESKKNALLLLHGFGATPAGFRYLIPALTKYDTIYSPNLPGHSTHLEDFAKVSSSDWMRTAENAFEALSKTHQQVDVLGLSLGGLLTLHLCKSKPVNHAYLLAPALALRLPLSTIIFLAKIMQTVGIQKIKNRAGNICHLDHSEITYRYLPLHSIVELFKLIQTFEYQAPACKVDLFLGMHDAVVCNESILKKMQNHPSLTVHELKRSAHVLTLDYDLDQIVAVLNQPVI